LQAEIITIGDEILIGQIVDTNSQYIAETLTDIGVSVNMIVSIKDTKEAILQAVRQAEERADIIIITGGLGSTNDDVTKKVLVDYFEDKLVKNTEIENHIKKLFKKINYDYTALDLEQALLPERAIILKNHFGTASGMWFAKSDKVIISLPGVPVEMKGLMQKSILPKLQSDFDLPYIMHHTIETFGEGESRIAERLIKFEKELPENVGLAYLPSYGKTRLRITVKGKDKERLQIILNQQVDKLFALVKDIAIKQSSVSIEKEVLKIFTEKNLTLSTAESCTGGRIASKLTAIPGTSAYYKGTIVSYASEIKTSILKVSKKTIAKYSVVSSQVASEMAKNCLKLFKTDFAVATTGNAGPTTDKTDKSIGVVFIAVAWKDQVVVKEFNFGQPREKVIEKASVKALTMLLKQVVME
jgi:nicotinamide-nucleotide amidase